jgi:hypothetical protein
MGPAGTTFTTGADAVNSGNGKVVITYTPTPALTTSASPGGTLGASVHDTATLADGISPTGSITFNLYGPDDSTCSGPPAFTSGPPVNVSGNGSYQSGDFTPTAAGTYRWTASYSGDSNNNPSASPCNAANESVTIKASPTLATNASAAIAVGGQIHDTATVSGGSSPGGQITFSLYGPDDANCSGTAAFTDTKAVSGNGPYQSGDFSPTAPGTYRWVASYSGDAHNNAASSPCNAANESVTVSPAPRTLSVAKAGTGAGAVTSSPAGIDCGSTCSQTFDDGTVVSLTATPDSGSNFAGWTGACSGTGACQVAMGADHDVGATFTVNPPPPNPPDTTIGSAKINQAKHSATFTFTPQGKAKAVSGFECALVKKHKNATFAACTSPKTYKHLKPARYTFEVRAFDSAGKDATPATKKFRIK